MQSPPTFIGIDYGSKLAGTTVIAYEKNQTLVLLQSAKKKDADQFLLDWILKNKPAQVFIDAPLSLPGVYRSLDGYSDYFYRQADSSLKAMSPLFLGGLTARAMRLTARLKQEITVDIVETYPGHLARTLQLPDLGYKKAPEKIKAVCDAIEATFPLELPTEELINWHCFDAVLAWWSGFRYQQGQHSSFGSTEEGIIIV